MLPRIWICGIEESISIGLWSALGVDVGIVAAVFNRMALFMIGHGG